MKVANSTIIPPIKSARIINPILSTIRMNGVYLIGLIPSPIVMKENIKAIIAAIKPIPYANNHIPMICMILSINATMPPIIAITRIPLSASSILLIKHPPIYFI